MLFIGPSVEIWNFQNTLNHAKYVTPTEKAYDSIFLSPSLLLSKDYGSISGAIFHFRVKVSRAVFGWDWMTKVMRGRTHVREEAKHQTTQLTSSELVNPTTVITTSIVCILSQMQTSYSTMSNVHNNINSFAKKILK